MRWVVGSNHVGVRGADVIGGVGMHTYSIDIEPQQIIDWIMAESRVAPTEFRVSARRAIESRELPTRKEFRLGEEERDDLTEIATVGTLQIAPAHVADGWVLTIVVEDEFGPRILDESEATETEQEIDVDAFYDLFIGPRRGNASAVAEVEGPDAKERLTRLLKDIEMDRHGSSRGGPPR
jgi:hypothetical protein